ncbi:MAG: transposase [Anaerolineae bacterium]|nr:transposase [Anaerolineae bacterium]
MLTLPKKYDTLIAAFAPVFSRRIWPQVQVLVIGAILAPGKRTVTSALQIMGMSDEVHFQNYHRVLNRAVWSGLEVSRLLLGLLVSAFASAGTIVMAIDDTIERRRGAKIKAKGIYRDPVRSSHGHFVKASGLRWLRPARSAISSDSKPARVSSSITPNVASVVST